MTNFIRALAFFAIGAAIVFVLDFAPPEAIGVAFVAVLVLAFVGGLLARSRIEVAALTIGSMVGGTFSALAQSGGLNGPPSLSDAVGGILLVGVLMWFVGSAAFGLRTRYLRGASSANARYGGGRRRPSPPAGTGARELRPNELSIDIVPNRLTFLDQGGAPGRSSKTQKDRPARR